VLVTFMKKMMMKCGFRVERAIERIIIHTFNTKGSDGEFREISVYNLSIYMIHTCGRKRENPLTNSW